MNNDKVLAGIGPNGFKDIFEVKILLCYIIRSINQSVKKDYLISFLSGEGFVDYFTLVQALKELNDSSHIAIDPENLEIKLNKLGEKTAETLKFGIPSSLRDKIVDAAVKFFSTLKNNSDNEIRIQAVEDGYLLKGYIHDIGSDLLNFNFFVPDKEQAEFMSKRFRNNPIFAYKAMLAALLLDGDSLIELGNSINKLEKFE